MNYKEQLEFFSKLFPVELFTLKKRSPFAVRFDQGVISVFTFDNYLFVGGGNPFSFFGSPYLNVNLKEVNKFYRIYKKTGSRKVSKYGSRFRGSSYLLAISVFLEDNDFDNFLESDSEVNDVEVLDNDLEAERLLVRSEAIELKAVRFSLRDSNSEILEEVRSPAKGQSGLPRLEFNRNEDDDLVVDVNYVTNREKSSEGIYFSGKRSKFVSYGKAKVSIPYNHKSGKLETPFNIFGFSLKRKRGKHFYLDHVAKCTKDGFFESLVKSSQRKRVFLFIHGFNVSFLNSVYKCAQIKCDFKLKDPIVLFSWPSQGSVLDYSYDKESADYSRDAVFSLLEDLTREGIEEICVIAHSMGNLCLAQGLNRASTPPRKLTRLVMAAADIALDSFSDFHLKDIRRFFDKVALYVSNSDRAL